MAVDIMSWFSVTSVLVVGAVSLLAYWVWSSWQVFKTFEKMGLPGPSPSLLVGNFYDMMKMGFCDSFVQWQKKYGQLYGTYTFKTPTLMVADLDMVSELMIKKFSSFPNRFPQGIMKDKPWGDTLISIQDDHWKHVRKQLSPAFSSGKLKQMMPAIYRVLENLDKYAGEKAQTGEEVELKNTASCFTMDAIAGAAFGIHVDSLANPDNPFSVNGNNVVKQNFTLMFLLSMCPWLTPYLRKIGLSPIPLKPTNFFIDILSLALKERRLEQKSYNDFLQLLIEAEKEGSTQGPVDAEINHSDHLITSGQWSRKGLTDDEIKANGMLFFLAGYDTVATVMSFTLFHLAANPDALKKAQKEVDEKLGSNKVNYENASDLTYVDMCMNEAMRLNPPGFVLDRHVVEDVELGGYKLKKGMRVMIPAYAIHRDPQHWPEPEKFLPERHTPEAKAARHSFAFMPFGYGPRNCIGMRLAQLEVRMAVATVLQHYTPVLCDKSVYPPVVPYPQTRMIAKDGMWVKFKFRD